MYASFLVPYISTPSRVTPLSKTLIDNIFSYDIEDGIILGNGNIVTTISDHYARFLLLQKLNNKNPTKSEIYHHDFKKLNKNNLERDLVNTNWDAILGVNNGDVDKYFESFITIVNSIIAEHAPLKKISVKERKLRAKPWITKGILTSINNKNKTYRKYCRAKNQTRRDELHKLFKKYRNSINKIIKVSKAKYYHQYFNINKRNLLKVWEGIKEIIHCKSNTGQTVNSLRINGSLSTNQNQIANSFNTFFCNIPKEIQKR